MAIPLSVLTTLLVFLPSAAGPPGRISDEHQAFSLGMIEEAEKKRAKRFIEQAGQGSGSCPKEALLSALKYAASSDAKSKAIVFIGKGRGTCPGKDDEKTYLEETFEDITSRNAGSVAIHVLGIRAPGELVKEYFLLYLAEGNGGKFIRLVGFKT
jgi:hypothetical protein